jgi:deoxycytidylate deaminase
LNWYPSTGTIIFQGKNNLLENTVRDLFHEINRDHDYKALQIDGKQNDNSNTYTTIDRNKFEEEIGEILGRKFTDSELIVGLIGAIGTELKAIVDELVSRLKIYNYSSKEIRISHDVIPRLVKFAQPNHSNEYDRISSLMTAGNEARRKSFDNSILALGAVAEISEGRALDFQPPYRPRHAYIINSLKHPDEVVRLREIYSGGFFLIGIYSDENRRPRYLVDDKQINAADASRLMERDEDEHIPYGQRVRDTFHLSDFFVHIDPQNSEKMKRSLWRILDIIFGHPFKTPTFDEYAMFMAYSASLRSADLSRQVGAVLAQNEEIVASGANDCPRYGGGLYWPQYNDSQSEIIDESDGRDYMRGQDSNKIEKEKIISNIVDKFRNKTNDEKIISDLKDVLKESELEDITEYGRVVHAEMETLLTCSRNSIRSKGGALYCTTFPCHNCAKHIIAAGIKRVVYIEPYPKSKALEFHSDSISFGLIHNSVNDEKEEKTVHFEPFVGVGPRRFFDLFSMNLGSGYSIKRKNEDGHAIDWEPKEATLRIQMLPCSYLELETMATSIFNTSLEDLRGKNE